MQLRTNILLLSLFFTACEVTPVKQEQVTIDSTALAKDQTLQKVALVDSIPPTDHTQTTGTELEQNPVNTGKTQPADLVAFAQTLIGTPYVYGSTDPRVGFDCSGFITYVFNHFNIDVPRSSIDFTSLGKEVSIEQATQGDLILFTGTNPMETRVGHMGIVVANDAEGLHFIHSTSGKAMSVTISPFSERYKKRFVRVCRIF